MLRKDYIQRQFEEFGKVLAVILGYKKQNDWDNFQKELSDAVRKFTSLKVDVVENLSETDFEKNILDHPSLVPEQLKILADLLFEKLEFNLTGNEPEKYINLKNKCLRLYQHVADNQTENEFNLGVHYRLEFLKSI